MLRWVGKILVVALCIATFGMAGSAAAENVTVTIGVGDTVLALTGQTSPNAFVTITKNDTVIGTATADAGGDFSYTFPAQDGGIQNYKIYSQTVSGELTDTITATVNVAEHATTALHVFLPPTVQLQTIKPLYGQPLRFSGETIPGGIVAVHIDGAIYATTIADAAGVWVATVSTASLAAGQHSFFVQVTDSFGELSYPTVTRHFTVAAEPVQPPAQPSKPDGQPVAPQPPVITFPVPGTQWTQPTITVRGTSGDNTQVEVWDGDKIIGSVWANGEGEWQLPMRLEPRSYSLRARACLNGLCGGFSAIVNFEYVRSRPGRLPLRIFLPESVFVVDQNQRLVVRATVLDGKPPYKTSINWGGVIEEDVTGNAELSFAYRYNRPGRYVVAIDVSDATGRQNRVYVSVYVRPALSLAIPIGLLILSILLALLGIIWLLILRRRRKKRAAARRKSRGKRTPQRLAVRTKTRAPPVRRKR